MPNRYRDAEENGFFPAPGACWSCGSTQWTSCGDCDGPGCGAHCCSECGVVMGPNTLICADHARALVTAVMAEPDPEMTSQEALVDMLSEWGIYGAAGCSIEQARIASAADRARERSIN